MNKSIKQIVLLSLLFISFLSGCSNISDKLEPNNTDKNKLVNTPLKFTSEKSLKNHQQTIYTLYNKKEKIGNMKLDVTPSSDNKFYTIVKKIEKSSDIVQSDVTISADNLMPKKSHYRKTSDTEGENFDISTVYSENWKIKTKAKKSSNQSIDLPEYYYDNESLFVILGVLPFENSDTFKLNVSIPLSGRLTPLTLKYQGKEQVDVPYKKTECYKVISEDMEFWYSTTDRILYQYKKGDTLYKLINIAKN
ncbi:DUF3108 domain-containing protein [Enterococcus faecium]|uniref:DUF3108 domain-containing protein n=1 Tax=Enterococcus faecium TaxID=1352 RepID=UPI00115C6109|nr:DUF3108 domain-containing protein [Enterococcus faecium]